MEPIFTLAQFTPSEAERITGVNTALQRDWRRRGFLPINDGHARFDVFELARMMTLQVLADRGIGPSQTESVRDWCASAICFAAMRFVEAWDGEPTKALTWIELYASPPPPNPELTAVIQQLINEGNTDYELPKVGSHWGAQSKYLCQQLWKKLRFPAVAPASLFIWWADGTHTFTSSFDGKRDSSTSDDPRFAGPIIVIDLDALGSTLLDRAARPFAHVEFVEAGEVN